MRAERVGLWTLLQRDTEGQSQGAKLRTEYMKDVLDESKGSRCKHLTGARLSRDPYLPGDLGGSLTERSDPSSMKWFTFPGQRLWSASQSSHF